MTYLPNIPQPTDFLSVSQGNLLTNFQSLDSTFDVDHTAFSNTSANLGKHAQVTLFEVQADPTLTFPETMVYSKNVGTTPNRVTNLYFATKPETGMEQVLQLTGSIITSSGTVNPTSGAYNVFQTPWGFRIFMGTTGDLPLGANALTLSADTFGSTIYNAQATSLIGGSASYASITAGTSSNGLNLYVAGTNNKNFYWLVICP
jgi:hypothetical protein